MGSNAAAKVFAVPELAEWILVYVNTTHLVRAPRAFRAIHDTIHSSKQLKQKMFLEPIVASPIITWRMAKRRKRSLPNPTSESYCSPDGKETICVAPLNPIFTDPKWLMASTNVDIMRFDFNIKPLLNAPLISSAWGAKFITQPPASKVAVTYTAGCGGIGDSKYISQKEKMSVWITRSKGIRVHHLVKTIRDELVQLQRV